MWHPLYPYELYNHSSIALGVNGLLLPLFDSLVNR